MACGQRVAPGIAEVLRDHVAGLHLNRDQAKAAACILACRTGRLGGHRALCLRCGYIHFTYHSCRNRHCPRCGSLDQALWAQAQLQHLLPVSYFHLVFTVAASLRPFFAGSNRVPALNALFAAVSETLTQVAKRRGFQIAILAVLHTWTQRLRFHPHIHCLVLGGGLGPQGFVHCQRYLAPLKILRTVFKAKLLEKLQTLLREGQADVGRHSGHQLLRDASRRTWNIDIRRPLAGPQQVVHYFARYTRRIAISNRRIQHYDGHSVTFRWRDRRDANRQKTARVDGPTFCRLFLQHTLPSGFVRIRRYGLLANRVRRQAIGRCRELLGAEPPNLPVDESRAAACYRILGRDPLQCPNCRQARMVVVAEWRFPPPSLSYLPPSISPRPP